MFRVIQKFWLRILPQAGSDFEDEIRLEDPELDDKYRIHSDHPEVAGPFLKLVEVRELLSNLFNFDRFEIHQGRATLKIVTPNTRGIKRYELDRILETML